jgi:ABC-2 type transport system ATP-binding protein
MIRVEDLSKQYPGATAVDKLNFSCEAGEIVGFLGPNGAGKTTTMRMLTAFIRPSSGRATVAGYDVETHPLEVRRRVGYLPENVPLYGEMRVSEFLTWRATLKGVPRSKIRARVDEVSGLCGLGDVRKRIIEQLSKGFRQRVGLAESLVHDPPLLILDEPTVGLDPNQIRQVRALITELGKQHTIVLSSHILPEVEQVCARIVIIDKGKIVASDRPENLRRSLEGGSSLSVALRAPAGGALLGEREARDALAALPGLSEAPRVEADPNDRAVRAHLALAQGADPREEVFRLAVARGWVLVEMTRRAMTLEEIFVNLTTREATPAGSPESGPDPAAPPDAPAAPEAN